MKLTINNSPSRSGDGSSEFGRDDVDIASAAELVRPVINEVRSERLRQARLTFNAAWGLAILGATITIVGLVLMVWRGLVTAGAIATASGVITQFLSRTLFHLNCEANDRLDKNDADLSALETARLALALIEEIQDPGTRDSAILKVAENLRLERKIGI
jgi:hypothetical protein